MDMRPEDFAWVTTEILKIADLCCNGRVVSVLEGGYGSYNQQQRATRASTAKSGASVSNITIYIIVI
jgi:acetoin utilization deacetylase AcuC-like enzyme